MQQHGEKKRRKRRRENFNVFVVCNKLVEVGNFRYLEE